MIDRVVVVNDVSTARGGATAIALASIRALRERGIAVTFIVGDSGENQELRDLGVEILPLGQALLLDANPKEAIVRGLYNRLTSRKVGDWIASHDTPGTVYHVHTWAKILSPSIYHAMRPVADRLAISAHDYFLVCPNGGYVIYSSGRVCTYRPLHAACLLTNCDRRSYTHKLWRVARQRIQASVLSFRTSRPLVLAVHEGMRAGLERGGVPAHAIRVLRNPVRPFTNVRVAAERNREILFVGRLDPEKGADLAASAAKLAGAPMRVIGDGPMRAALQRDHPEIIFEGRKSHAEIAKFVESARAIIVPSRYPEPFGLIAAEAMWSGLPVIISQTALIAREITESGAGLACNVHDDIELAAALRHVATDHAAAEQMSHRAFSATRNIGRTPEEWSECLIAIYSELISKIHT